MQTRVRIRQKIWTTGITIAVGSSFSIMDLGSPFNKILIIVAMSKNTNPTTATTLSELILFLFIIIPL
jgi:hypothetical protein